MYVCFESLKNIFSNLYVVIDYPVQILAIKEKKVIYLGISPTIF